MQKLMYILMIFYKETRINCEIKIKYEIKIFEVDKFLNIEYVYVVHSHFYWITIF